MKIVDLTKNTGFPAKLNTMTGEILFAKTAPLVLEERKIKDLTAVWKTPPLQNEESLHRIYRFIGDSKKVRESGLKYDITVVLPGVQGDEFFKTTGHYHTPLEDGMPSPDFYQLLYGTGKLLLQKRNNGRVQPLVVTPSRMQAVLIPPEYGHLAVNTGSEPMVFANICVRKPHLDYAPYLQNKGGAYYFTSRGAEENPNYSKNGLKVGKLSEATPSKSSGGIQAIASEIPFYSVLSSRPGELEFLTKPAKYSKEFKKALALK